VASYFVGIGSAQKLSAPEGADNLGAHGIACTYDRTQGTVTCLKVNYCINIPSYSQSQLNQSVSQLIVLNFWNIRLRHINIKLKSYTSGV